EGDVDGHRGIMPGNARSQKGPPDPRPPRSLAVEVEDEVELRSARLGLQLHDASRVAIGARPACDGECRVLRVEEGALDDDVAVLQKGRPVALVGAWSLDADAVAGVPSDLRR